VDKVVIREPIILVAAVEVLQIIPVQEAAVMEVQV